jgi:hypothetical protein
MPIEMGHKEEFVHDLWMSNKAHFHLDTFMNKQNFCYYSEESPRQRHQGLLRSDQVTVMRNFISRHYWIFFLDYNGRLRIVTSSLYFNMILTLLTDELGTM